MKAIIMASANHDIENGIDRDGAGGISASWADDVVTGVFGQWGTNTVLCSDPTTVVTLSLQAGLQTRIIIVWSTDPSDPNYFVQPSSDLNIKLYDPLGNRIFQGLGNSLGNTVEFITWTTTIGGDYTLKIARPRCDRDPGEVAFATWQFH